MSRRVAKANRIQYNNTLNQLTGQLSYNKNSKNRKICLAYDFPL
jgi:hypothetical protein